MRSPAAEVDPRTFAPTALSCFAVMMAYHVASRATRDALFLSSFSVNALPLMVAAASVLSIVSAIGAARLLSRFGPMRMIPNTFALSGLIAIAEWLIATRAPAATAVIVYLHVASIGPVLVSGFWSILNERLDPRTAKREIGRITAIGTLGGLAGGLLAERSASWFGIPGTLGVLAIMQGWCAWSLRGLSGRSEIPAPAGEPPARISASDAIRRLIGTSYLKNLVLLVFGSSVSAALLDFVFKAQSVGAMPPGLGLLRLFAAFYAVVALLTFAIQALFTRVALERTGLVPSIAALPGAVLVGGVATVLVPGPWSVGFARGLEAVLRGSLFRSGYEVLYTPIPAPEKRATKAIVDVGFDRLGDMVGAGLIAFVLVFPASVTTVALMSIAIAFSLAMLALVARLQRGYVSSLEAGLRAGAVELDSVEIPDWTMARTLHGTHDIRGLTPLPAGARNAALAAAAGASPDPLSPVHGALPDDDLTRRLKALRSADPARARDALVKGPALDPVLVPQCIALLAWDEVAREAVLALRAVASRHVGQLLDELLDPATDFTVRRRIPSVLIACREPRAVEGLMRGLADSRFEVRYRCGSALGGILEANPSLRVDPEAVFDAVRREARVGRAVWDSQRLLEQLDETGHESFVDDFVRERASRSIQHVFALLALVLPREPLKISFRGLHAEDPVLRGLALEYLESVLPPAVRDELWPHLEGDLHRPAGAGSAPRGRGEILGDLLRSNLSIGIDVAELRRIHQEHVATPIPKTPSDP